MGQYSSSEITANSTLPSVVSTGMEIVSDSRSSSDNSAPEQSSNTEPITTLNNEPTILIPSTGSTTDSVQLADTSALSNDNLLSTSVSVPNLTSTKRTATVASELADSETKEETPSLMESYLGHIFGSSRRRQKRSGELYVVSSDEVEGYTEDLETAKSYITEEIKCHLIGHYFRHKEVDKEINESFRHTRSDKHASVVYSATVWEQNPLMIFGQRSVVIQYSVWKVPCLTLLHSKSSNFGSISTKSKTR